MLTKIKSFFDTLVELDDNLASDDHHLAISALLCEVCSADNNIAPQEERVIEQTLIKLLGIDSVQAQTLLQAGKEKTAVSNSLFEFTTQLRHLEHSMRNQLIKAMWEVAYADQQLDPIEEHVIRKVSDLIYVNHRDFIRNKLAVINSLADPITIK